MTDKKPRVAFPGVPDGPQTDEQRAERMAALEAYMAQIFQDRADAIEETRRRAGLSVDDLAKEMGFKSASGIQRYLSPLYDRGFRPEIARAFRNAFLGKGTPPITDDDLLFLLREKAPEPGDPAWEQHDLIRRITNQERELISASDEQPTGNRMIVRLPLVEGDAVMQMPRYMSEKSLEALKSWLNHLSAYAQDSADLIKKTNSYDPHDAAQGKRW